MLSQTTQETKQYAAQIAQTLHGGEVLLLEGPLGAGKTTFVQGLVEALGKTDRFVRSPTFSIMNVYPIDTHKTIKQLIHLDFYRLKNPDEMRSLGLEEFLGQPGTVFAAEWPPEAFSPASQTIRRFRFRLQDLQTRIIEEEKT